MTALQPISNLTATAVKQAGAKSWFTDLRSFLATILGSDGSKATARVTLLAPGAAGTVHKSNGTNSDPSWQYGGPSDFFFAKVGNPGDPDCTGDGTTATASFTNEISAGTGVFTAPASGFYQLNFTLRCANPTLKSSIYAGIDTSGSNNYGCGFKHVYPTPNNDLSFSGAFCCHLSQGDTVKIIIIGDGGTKDVSVIGGLGTFSGYRLA